MFIIFRNLDGVAKKSARLSLVHNSGQLGHLYFKMLNHDRMCIDLLPDIFQITPEFLGVLITSIKPPPHLL